MKTYVYGYDIKTEYDESPKTVTAGDRRTIVSRGDQLTEDEVIHRAYQRICTASNCYTNSLEERIKEAKKVIEITNAKLVREFGKEDK